MVSKLRQQRIAEEIYQQISTLLVTQVSDPRLATVNVSGVEVDRELMYADVFVSSVDGIAAAPAILEGLQHAQGFLRSEIARRMKLRIFPKLRFHWDPTPERGDRMERLFAQLQHEKSQQAGEANA